VVSSGIIFFVCFRVMVAVDLIKEEEDRVVVSSISNVMTRTINDTTKQVFRIF
jgi:hypothetical protein